MKLIDKEKVVEEIEKLKAYLQIPNAQLEAIKVCDNVISIINTLETKEVDLEREFYDFLDTLIGKDNGHLSEDELFRIAEYFFELGLNAKKK